MRTLSLTAFGVLVFGVVAACNEKEPPIAPEVVAVERAPAPDRLEREHYLGMAVPDHAPVPFPNVRGECEPGQVKLCPVQKIALPPDDGESRRPPTRDGVPPDTSGLLAMHCREAPGGAPRFDLSDCATPIVVAFDDEPIMFVQAAGAFGVGPFARTEWVSSRTPWLALDRDGSGCIEDQGELFRYDQLAALDDDHDGRIGAHDAAFGRLVLWADRDQDRRCTAREMVTLEDAGIVSLDVELAPERDHAFGSHEGEHAALAYRTRDGQLHRGRIVDVYLAPLP
jgi:hypothetical protein